jgi:hypothetical protein
LGFFLACFIGYWLVSRLWLTFFSVQARKMRLLLNLPLGVWGGAVMYVMCARMKSFSVSDLVLVVVLRIDVRWESNIIKLRFL